MQFRSSIYLPFGAWLCDLNADNKNTLHRMRKTHTMQTNLPASLRSLSLSLSITCVALIWLVVAFISVLFTSLLFSCFSPRVNIRTTWKLFVYLVWSNVVLLSYHQIVCFSSFPRSFRHPISHYVIYIFLSISVELYFSWVGVIFIPLKLEYFPV